MRKIQKTAVFAVMLSMAFSLTCYAKDVVLKNADKPFIDLGMLVTDSAPGQEAKPETGNVETENETEPQIAEDIVIEVRHTQIRLNGAVMKNPEELVGRVRAKYTGETALRLIDDYAELHTYEKVLDRLTDAGYTPEEVQAE